MKKILFVDVDGTVANTPHWWLTLYNRKYRTAWTVDQITEWDWRTLLEHDISEFYGNYIGAKPMTDALESIWRLAGKYRIVFATAGWGREWLRSYYPTFRDENFVQVADKSLLNGWGLIDDNPANLDVFQGQRFLLRQPWNVNRGLNDSDWQTIADYLEAL
jgi:5'(3')-deoxyribonucleotidase